MLDKGPLLGFPVVGVRVVINDGASTRSTRPTSRSRRPPAARGARVRPRQAADPRADHEGRRRGPAEFSGGILGTLMQRRGMIIGSTRRTAARPVEAEVPLAEMFGSPPPLRSSPRGRGGSAGGSPRSLRSRQRWPRSSCRRRPARRPPRAARGKSPPAPMFRKEAILQSPLRILDRSIRGGLGKGHLGVIMAPAGVGKSACLVQIGLDALLREKPVLHVAVGQIRGARLRPLRRALRRPRRACRPGRPPGRARVDRPPAAHLVVGGGQLQRATARRGAGCVPGAPQGRALHHPRRRVRLGRARGAPRPSARSRRARLASAPRSG